MPEDQVVESFEEMARSVPLALTPSELGSELATYSKSEVYFRMVRLLGSQLHRYKRS
jgi:hypothetical protein